MVEEAQRAEQHREHVSLAARPLIFAVRVYQAVLGSHLGGHCRFVPSCSEYAIEALRCHGALGGSWLALRRLLRCQPLGGAGLDPVPPRKG
ncbi:MAG: membrane protein insertion efficiency factor YidD [Planctomycetota bacterium]|jgi:putative membrane protein insertion efficiency factor